MYGVTAHRTSRIRRLLRAKSFSKNLYRHWIMTQNQKKSLRGCLRLLRMRKSTSLIHSWPCRVDDLLNTINTTAQ
ncbi:hypothetical protein OESDEN_23325 [Oesophagostomum dentatum]|uniref:Uncharacterized protein n=1 Tax=Oesophagostomum dentatum TaxID=61180 RepID=A0A0B1S1G3_OESDE|nr:hypothetical protein OESDEN_23325 [Oesophagostomum dentatum]